MEYLMLAGGALAVYLTIYGFMAWLESGETIDEYLVRVGEKKGGNSAIPRTKSGSSSCSSTPAERSR
jgi:hypothetical protein